MIETEGCFEAPHIFKRSQVHSLRENPGIRAALCADVFPPEKLAFQFGRKVSRKAA